MIRYRYVGVLVIFLAVLAGSSLVAAQVFSLQHSAGWNWEKAGFDDENSGLNPQMQINKGDVKDLGVKWVYQIPQNPFTGSLASISGIKTRPLVMNGTVYIATAYNRVIALNAKTGNEVWSFQVNLTKAVSKPWVSPIVDLHHITSYNGIIYLQAADCAIYGLDAKDGSVEFTIPDPCKDIPGGSYRYVGRSAPVIYEKQDVLILGSGGQSSGRGFIAGYNLTNSQLLWRWFIIPPWGGDPDWDTKYTVQKGDGSYISGPSKGNIAPYLGDWGSSNRIVGGTSWDLNLVDQESGIVYIATSVPEGPDSKLFPGPNLYGSSMVALNATTGEMLWYYQMTPHDLYWHGVPFQTGVLAEVRLENKVVKAVLTGSKSGYVYAFNAENGSLLWDPVKLGIHLNDGNDNAGNDANMTISQKDLVGKIICPLQGVFAPSAFAYNTLYVTAQNNCGTPTPTGVDSWRYSAVGPVNSTLYAIDASNGQIKWTFYMPNQYQGAAVAVSGRVVYAVDRTGILYALDADTGRLIRTLNLGGVGAAGVSIGADDEGKMMIFIASGGAGSTKTTPGIVIALGK